MTAEEKVSLAIKLTYLGMAAGFTYVAVRSMPKTSRPKKTKVKKLPKKAQHVKDSVNLEKDIDKQIETLTFWDIVTREG